MRFIRPAAFVVGFLGLIVTCWLVFVGGIDLTSLHLPFTAHNPRRSAVVAVVAFAAFALAKGKLDFLRSWLATLDRVDDRFLAVPLAMTMTVVGIAYATTAASGSDAYGYVSQADEWLSGHLVIPQEWAQQAPWPSSRWSFAPLGYRPGDGQYEWSLVPTYSAGLPMMMAAAKFIGGQEGMFWVVPIAGGLLVLATFGVGRRLGASRAGLAGAFLVATSPVFLFMLMWPMTDVPVAAAWVIAVYFLLGESAASAFAAGLAGAVATLIRPNLVIEAPVLGLWFAIRAWRSGAWRRELGRACLFGAGLAPGVIAVAVINQHLYGSPLRSGYAGFSGWFSHENVAPNAGNYLRWFLFAQTPIGFVGLAALAVPLKRVWSGVRDRAVFLVIGLFVAVMLGEYLAFMVFDVWWYLRFLLACLPFVMIGVGAVASAAARTRRPLVTVAAIAIVALLGLRDFRIAVQESAFRLWEGERRYVSIARLVRAATERTSVIFSMQHSGSLRYYAGRLTVRYDAIDDGWLDRSVTWFESKNLHPYLLAEDWEVDRFKTQFAGAKALAMLNGAPLFTYEGGATVLLFDLAQQRSPSAGTTTVVETFADRLRSVRPVAPAWKISSAQSPPLVLAAGPHPR